LEPIWLLLLLGKKRKKGSGAGPYDWKIMVFGTLVVGLSLLVFFFIAALLTPLVVG